MSENKSSEPDRPVLQNKDDSESPYQWDPYSDQPYPIKDKIYKKKIRRQALPANLKLLVVNALIFPLVLLKYFFLPRFQHEQVSPRIGLCVNLDKEPDLSPSLIAELGVKRLSLRIPLSDVANIDRYQEYATSFQQVEWLFVVLQDREHIDDPSLCEASFREVYSKLSPLGNNFQIGNAINRTKWGFSSVDEYLAFFKIAQKVRDEGFPTLELLGSSVIDFEVYALLRSLWHGFSLKYDGIAALLYVDRRGAPENKQFIFDLVGKINFFWSALSLSSKASKRLVISEVNWPIEHTKPYAPALGDVWVSEDTYGKYLLRYYLLALANGRAECVYWHQLIAPGYGLIDNREGVLRKRRAYFMFKILCDVMNNAAIERVDEGRNSVEITARSPKRGEFRIVWSLSGLCQKAVQEDIEVYDAVGAPLSLSKGQCEVGEEPLYFFQKA